MIELAMFSFIENNPSNIQLNNSFRYLNMFITQAQKQSIQFFFELQLQKHEFMFCKLTRLQ